MQLKGLQKGPIAAWFRVPKEDQDFMDKLNRYKTERIGRIRRYGRGRGVPRNESSNVSVENAKWFGIYFDDAYDKKMYGKWCEAQEELLVLTSQAQLDAEIMDDLNARLATANQEREEYQTQRDAMHSEVARLGDELGLADQRVDKLTGDILAVRRHYKNKTDELIANFDEELKRSDRRTFRVAVAAVIVMIVSVTMHVI
jgi:hypothetical protein